VQPRCLDAKTVSRLLVALNNVFGDDARTKGEDVRIVWLDRHVKPVMIWRPKRLHPQEILQGRENNALAGAAAA
jgi:hypothetical protein